MDSLPFMWTKEDAKLGKVPYNVDVYCAQKSIKLTNESKEIFDNVKNLKWINPIIPKIEETKILLKEESIVINLGGLHSPVGNGEEYIKATIIPLIEILKSKYNYNIIITAGSDAVKKVQKKLKDYDVEVKTYKQKQFLSVVNQSKIFFTSPGLTTIFETMNLDKETIFLPPQNLSQFYNVEYAKKIIHKYKVIFWNKSSLSLENLKDINETESEIVKKIYLEIKKSSSKNYVEKMKNNITSILEENYNVNKNYKKSNLNGAYEVIKYIKEVCKQVYT